MRLQSPLRRDVLAALLASTVALACLVLLSLFVLVSFVSSAVAAVDLSGVELRRGDFPSGFRPIAQDVLVDAGQRADEMGKSFESAFEHASMRNFTVFANASGSELIESFVIGPMTKLEVKRFDADLRDRKAFVDMAAEGMTPWFATAGTPRDLHADRASDTALGISVPLHTDGDTTWLGTVLGGKASEAQAQMVVGRRGEFLLLLFLMHAGADRPRTDIVRLAGILDTRLARAQGIGGESQFVASVPLPTEVSRDPAVIGTNLALALIFALGFGFTSTLFNSTLRENHATLRRWVDPVLRPFSAAAGKLKIGSTTGAAPRSRARRLLEPISIVVLAALIYSFLDPDFGLSTQGLQLFLSLLVSVAVVTFLYEGVQTGLCRARFHTPAALKLYPAALLVAVGCVVASRVVGFSPGYLYGFVGAMAFLSAAEPTIPCRGRMVLIASVGLMAVSVGTWFLAVPLTDAAASGGWLMQLLQGTAVAVFVAGLESVFFGLIPLSFMDGETLLRWRKPIWLALFAAVAFMFWHVLLNKDSQYAAAFGGQSTRVMITLLGVFTTLTLVSYFYFRSRRPRVGPVVAAAGPMVAAGGALAGRAQTTAAAVRQTSASATLSVEPQSIAATPAGSVLAEGTKTCPACGASIRAAARLCRFCRAQFELRRFAYCAACHDVVRTDEACACGSCGAATQDVHVETLLIGTRSPLSPVAAAPAAAAVAAGPAPASARRAKAARTSALLDERRRALGIPARLQPLAILAGLSGIAAGCGLFWVWSLPWYEETQKYVLFYENPPGLIACGVALVILGIVTIICQRRRMAVLSLGMVSILVGCLAVYVTMTGRDTLAGAGIGTGSMFRVALGLSALAVVPGILACVASLRMRKTGGRTR
jgi:hypothetical protein